MDHAVLDNPVPDIGVPALIPTPYKRFLPSLKTIVYKASAKIVKRVNEFADWMMNHIPPRTKAIVSNSIKKILNLFPKVKLLKTALKDFTKSYEVDIIYSDDPQKQLFATKNIVEDKLRLEVKKMNGLLAIITLKITFEKQRRFETITKQAFFNCKTFIILKQEDFDGMLEYVANQIINKIGDWLSEGSGWVISSVDAHYLNVVKYTPLNASFYIELPEELRNAKKGLISIKNQDNECFRWCHLAKVYSDKVKSNRERISHYKKYVDTLNYDGIEFPVSIKQIPKIEDQNNISINVIGYENKNRFPLYVSKKVTETTLDLLLIWEEEEKQHYVWIKD